MITVTRRVQFSAAHFYYLDSLSPEENQQTFKACSNRHGHGHNYEVFVSVQGPMDPETGMVMNLKDLKEILQDEIVEPMDHKNLNHQLDFFKTHVPTLENIARYIRQRLTPRLLPYGLELTNLKVVENESLYVEYQHMLFLTRRYDFCASHRLYNPEFSDTQNWEVFRECNNPHGHGHNYELEVTLTGEADPNTGMLVDIELLDRWVQETLIQKVDHRHFNFDVPFMKDIIPTAENVVYTFWQQLAPQIPPPLKLHRMRLFESKNNMAEYQGGQPV